VARGGDGEDSSEATARSRSTDAGSAVDRAVALLTADARSRAAEARRPWIETLPPEPTSAPGPAQALMLSPALARVYERWWRPAWGRVAKGVLGPGMAEERRIARLMLALAPGDRVLDVACGTGSFTRELARAVGPEGLALGLDVSEPMLRRAVAQTVGAGLPQVAWIRADAEELPFRAASFDGVCCFAALNLMPHPMRTLDRIAAILRPGGRIALFTSAAARSALIRAPESLAARLSGMRLFGPRELVEALEERGFDDISQRLTGVTQFVGGRLGR
jgi:ubiquinone/menaquinone biosynthesis C-methylase UbiE